MARPLRETKWLDKRNGVYNACWYEAPPSEPGAKPKPGRTKRFGLRTRDPATAEARFAAFLVEGDTIFATPGGDAGITVSRALDDYYTEHVLVSPADPVRQENAIRHLKAFFGDKRLASIDIPACRSYAKARSAGSIGGGARHKGDRKKGANSTIEREINALKAAANHALRWKRISLADMPTFEAPKVDAVQQDVGFLTKYQIATLIFEAEGALRDFIILGYMWGARRASIELLEERQINFSAGHVKLLKTGEAATRKRKPVVPIFPEVRALLERRVKDAAGGWLFSQTVDFYRPFRRLCKQLKLPYEHPHVLRHSRATHMLMDGVSIYKVARLIGDTVQTVERVYGHHSVEFLMEGTRA